MVATPLPACVHEAVVRTAADAEGFAAEIDGALRMSVSQRIELRTVAEGAGWGQRVAPLLGWLREQDRLFVS